MKEDSLLFTLSTSGFCIIDDFGQTWNVGDVVEFDELF